MARLDITLRNSNLAPAAARFVMVGLLGTAVDFSIFSFLHGLPGMSTLLANTLSYSVGIINNYFFHRYWTFGRRARKEAGRQFSQFAAVSLGALVLNNLLVLLLSPLLGQFFTNDALGAICAKLIATAVGMCWNFLANYLWTFRNTLD